MKKLLPFVALAIFMSFIVPSRTYAASEAACAIWLCLPGGFPSGCSAAHSEFKHRIKKGKPPLPDLGSCTTGPNGEKANGSYQLGYEIFEPCKEGYVLEQSNSTGLYMANGRCVLKQCNGYSGWNRNNCITRDSYAAVRRVQPNYVKMWVDGQYIGQYWY